MINLITLIGNKCNSNKKENIYLMKKIFEKKFRKNLFINTVHIYRLSKFNNSLVTRIDINIHLGYNFRYQNSTYERRRYPLNTTSDLPKVRTNT
jgi:hypothetical protein